jgi:hypothetical protein
MFSAGNSARLANQGGGVEHRPCDRRIRLGSHSIVQLLAAGHQVRTTVRSLKREGEVRAMLQEGGAVPGDRLSFITADLGKDEGWPEAIAGCEYGFFTWHRPFT